MKYPNGFFRDKSCRKCETVYTPVAPSHHYCSEECAKWGKTSAYYKRNYGLNLDQVNELYEAADHKCGLCKSEGFLMGTNGHTQTLVVDHCHTTGVVRGILCHNCNRALGLMQDSPDILRLAAAWVERATTIPKGSTPEANAGGNGKQ